MATLRAPHDAATPLPQSLFPVNRHQSRLLQAALAMAARGWHVFPCAVNGKQPALRGNWQHHATTDPAQIRNWWQARPYNIGLACGPSGLVVVDLDVPKGPGQESGAVAFGRLSAQAGQPGPWPTFEVSTPSGGRHLYFRAPGRPIPNSASRVAPLIDIRASGGYVIAPASQIDGRPYQAHGTVPPAPLPGWLAGKLTRQPARPPAPARHIIPTASSTAYATAALRSEAHRVATAVDGTRHDTLNRAAFSLGQLVGSGLLPETTVITSLTDAARHCGLPERDIPRIIRSGMTAGAASPRTPRYNPQPAGPGPYRPRLSPDDPPQPRTRLPRPPPPPYRTGPAAPLPRLQR